MKKILIIGLIVLTIFLIYLCNMDKKIYYLALGDSLASGQDSDGNNSKGYTEYVKDYLKGKKLLETYINEFAEKGYRVTDLINDIKYNKKIRKAGNEITIQNALIKSDLVTISIGANDILSKINIEENIEYDRIYDYIDELTIDLEKLLKLIREYCKEDILVIGYYNPYPYLNNKNTDEIFEYLNKNYEKACNKYKIKYIKIDNLFKKNSNFLKENNIHPAPKAYEAIAKQIIITINKTTLNS